MIALNDLNSIILEGTVAERPKSYQDQFFFPIKTKRREMVRNKQVCKTFHFMVGMKRAVAERYSQSLSAGKKVRAVGHLRFERNGASRVSSAVFVEAEHIDIKPSSRPVSA